MKIKIVSIFVSRYLEPSKDEIYNNHGKEKPHIYSDQQAQDMINSVIEALEGVYEVKDIKINETPMLYIHNSFLDCIRRTYTLLLEEKK